MGHAQQSFGDAMAAHRAGNIDSAEALYRSILVEQPFDTNALNLLAAVLRRRDRFDEALDLSRRALATDSSCIINRFNFAECLRASGFLDEAIREYEYCIERQPHHPQVHHSLGQAYAALGKRGLAVRAYRAAVSLRPRFYSAHVELAGHLLRSGEFAEAERLCREAILISTLLGPEGHETASIYALLGDIMRGTNRYLDAVENYQHAVRLRPRWAAVYAALAACLNALHRYSQSVEAARHAADLDGNCTLAFVELGTALEHRGQPLAAMDAFGRAMELRPDSSRTQMLLGRTQLQCLRQDEAMSSYRRAIEMSPASVDVHEGILAALNYSASTGDHVVYEAHVNWALHASGAVGRLRSAPVSDR